ncbi:V-type ATP synthase subunit F [Candidatus Woesearchaeota archaeon]|nr:V-type ATP synthase subunit F [Candidatus Woesearchaeota archaeon]
MKRIAVLGTEEFAVGFRLAGIRDVHLAEGNVLSQARSIMQDRELGIVVMDEASFSRVPEDFRPELENSIDPVLVVLSAAGAGQESLRKQIIKAVGVDLMKGETA